MKLIKKLFVLVVAALLVACGQEEKVAGHLYEPFVHPGMFQNSEDLAFLKDCVLAGKEPWLSAYNRLKAETDTNFTVKSFNYVSVGAYGANSIGGKEFSSAAKYAYSCALLWYVTGERIYAEQAIKVLNAWSYALWGFDGNNAKLNVGLFGQYYLNAAELLKYTDSGWSEREVKQFERMLRTVYYPTIKDFFTEANGNWDASMICTMLCMGVFLDDHDMFNRAVERFYRGDGNGGITKYIYPGGQCQETTRDWDHVQLGLGEFAKACQVAWTQGLDFYSVADHRLAQGFEYASRFLLGYKVPVWGDISYRYRERVHDIYRSVYNHYAAVEGIDLTNTKQMMDKSAEETTWELLSATRHTDGCLNRENLVALQVAQMIRPAETGALPAGGAVLENAIVVKPGDNIQEAIDGSVGRWVVLKEGVHVLDKPLQLHSGVRLAGEGRQTVLMLAKECDAPTIINKDKNMSNVIVRSLLIEGATKPGTGFDPNYERSGRLYGNAPSREGIVFLSDSVGRMKDIRLENLTVQNFTKNGVMISGASHVWVTRCDFDNNGSAVVPGPHFHHNLRLAHVEDVEVSGNRFDSSLWGHGLELSVSKRVRVKENEFARNALCGIYCGDVQDVTIASNLIEGNSASGINLETLMDGCFNVRIENNEICHNKGYAIEGLAKSVLTADNISNANLYD